ncbi:hypothetical protein M427DRAFT_395564 [Gonapodya prolifera JEL478]|uniref:WD40 repeat-like protein n=1 Tax=Gonapodya prolifera (strain JEL478) TaxID=1344416 RepID=A0A139A7B1_GONPJ|nr:hypothetical protein M427DRAFT_395564 [Gonapodya prolifera JEL478]|eukprot:KXS12548.1 hypothetical protein M427DRAFT_395564 [Gonapodya prolifera JEL478]
MSSSTSGSTEHQSVRIVRSSYSSKYTSRKPREILSVPSRLDQGRPVAPLNNDFSNMLVTTTLDGCVRVWDVDKRIPVVTVPSNVLDVTWPEAACWLPNNVLAIAPALSFQQKGEITKSRHEMVTLSSYFRRIPMIHVPSSPQCDCRSFFATFHPLTEVLQLPTTLPGASKIGCQTHGRTLPAGVVINLEVPSLQPLEGLKR